MPRKKVGHTFVLVEFPDDLLAVVRAKAGKGGLTSFVCGCLSDVTGVEYTHAKKGAPFGTGAAPKKPARKKK